jgi:hypothetical protein
MLFSEYPETSATGRDDGEEYSILLFPSVHEGMVFRLDTKYLA